mmetsp:Transcript_81582/g.210065  ORF Transcript_81582/g.210065 Transcript_81582/m.210065 type:complete len:305 (+) Transcript_81582:2084-2998(+)
MSSFARETFAVFSSRSREDVPSRCRCTSIAVLPSSSPWAFMITAGLAWLPRMVSLRNATGFRSWRLRLASARPSLRVASWHAACMSPTTNFTVSLSDPLSWMYCKRIRSRCRKSSSAGSGSSCTSEMPTCPRRSSTDMVEPQIVGSPSSNLTVQLLFLVTALLSSNESTVRSPTRETMQTCSSSKVRRAERRTSGMWCLRPSTMTSSEREPSPSKGRSQPYGTSPASGGTSTAVSSTLFVPAHGCTSISVLLRRQRLTATKSEPSLKTSASTPRSGQTATLQTAWFVPRSAKGVQPAAWSEQTT